VAWWPKVLQSCNTVQKEMELLCLPTSEEAALFQVIGVRETEAVEIRGKAPPTTLRIASQSTAGRRGGGGAAVGR